MKAVLTGGLTLPKLVTTYTLMPLAGDAMNPAPVLPYGWTLCYEFLFYLAATGLANVKNAFEPWDVGESLDPQRHPLRAFDKELKSAPWKTVVVHVEGQP